MKRKLLCLLLCTVFTIGTFVGCGSAPSRRQGDDPKATSDSSFRLPGLSHNSSSGKDDTSGISDNTDSSDTGGLSGLLSDIGLGDNSQGLFHKWPTWEPEPEPAPIVVPDPVAVPDPVFVNLSGAQFQDPLSYYGLGLWDLIERTESHCKLVMEEVPKNYLDEFVADMASLNPQFTLVDTDVLDFETYYYCYKITYYYAYAPAVTGEDTWHFSIALQITDHYTPGLEYSLEWDWKDNVTLADAGARAEVTPVSTTSMPAFMPTNAPHPSVRLEGPKMQNPLSYYGMDMWDLDSSEDYVNSNKAVVYVESLPEEFLAEFVRSVYYLNPHFVLWAIQDDDWSGIGQGRQMICYFDYIPEDGSENTVHDDFQVELRFGRGSEIRLIWSWKENITLVDAGLRATELPVSTSTKTFYVAGEPSEYAGRLLGTPNFQDPALYFGITDNQYTRNSEGERGLDIVEPGRDFLKEYLADVEKLNPDFNLVYVTEEDYYFVGGDYYLSYYYRYEPADGDYRGLSPDEPYHFRIGLNVGLYDGGGFLNWSWKPGVVLADAEIQAENMPVTSVPSSGGNGGYGNGGSSGRSDFWDNDRNNNNSSPRQSCPHCMDGTEDCSRCDGKGGKYIYITVPNYSGHGDTEKEKWENCSKCHGSGKQDCHWCGGDEWLD